MSGALRRFRAHGLTLAMGLVVIALLGTPRL
jgi:hypothetical protein